MKRGTLIDLAEAMENLMLEIGKGKTKNDRKLYSLCYPLWIKIQEILRHKEYD